MFWTSCSVGCLDAKQCFPTVRKHSRQTVYKHCLPTMFVGVKEPCLTSWVTVSPILNSWYSNQRIDILTSFCWLCVTSIVLRTLILQTSEFPCSTHGRNAYKILVGNPEGKRPPGDLGIDGKKTKMSLREMGFNDIYWINLDQDRVWWWCVVNTEINLWISWMAGFFYLSEVLLTSQILCSVALVMCAFLLTIHR
jgi:hypothetical protein